MESFEARKIICESLGLPEIDSYTQDWECEVPPAFRTKKWLENYISYYSLGNCSVAEKKVLMPLIVDIANDFFEKNFDEQQVEKVLHLLLKNKEIHSELINKWACEEDALEDSFALTKKIRALK